MYWKGKRLIIRSHFKNCCTHQVNKWHMHVYGKLPARLVIKSTLKALSIDHFGPYWLLVSYSDRSSLKLIWSSRTVGDRSLIRIENWKGLGMNINIAMPMESVVVYACKFVCLTQRLVPRWMQGSVSILPFACWYIDEKTVSKIQLKKLNGSWCICMVQCMHYFTKFKTKP